MFLSGETFKKHDESTIASVSLISECLFDGCETTESGGGVYIRGTAFISVNHCQFCDCKANINGGGLGLETSSSSVNRTLFVGCKCNVWGSGVVQRCKTQNIVDLNTFLVCKILVADWYSHAALRQIVGFSIMNLVNGSYLFSIERESAYHHGSGPLSHVSFSTFACCSGKYTISFHCASNPTQIAENVCTTNSTVTGSAAIPFGGSHLVKDFVIWESCQLILRDPDFKGTITMQGCFFGCPSMSTNWLTISSCEFSCSSKSLFSYFLDYNRCFVRRSNLFTLRDSHLRIFVFVLFVKKILAR